MLALVLGIIAIIISLLPSFGPKHMAGSALAIVALYLGAIARHQARAPGARRRLATAAMVAAICAFFAAGVVFATRLRC